MPTWSLLDLWGLVKGSNGRNTERALSTAAQLWLSVASAHSLFPHFKDCMYLLNQDSDIWMAHLGCSVGVWFLRRNGTQMQSYPVYLINNLQISVHSSPSRAVAKYQSILRSVSLDIPLFKGHPIACMSWQSGSDLV